MELHFDSDGRSKLIEGITKISRAVKSTLGPMGNTVLIESPNHTHGITVTKDGVTVARSIELDDPVESLAVRMMKQAADRTATLAGDGTTTSIVLTEALVRSGMEKEITPEVLRELKSVTEQICSDLSDEALACEGDRLNHVASISSNNDPVLGSIISSVYNEVGSDGVVTCC